MTTFKLLSTTGDQSVEFAVGRILVVGRAVASDFPIYDPTVSRRHAELTQRDGGVHVKDLGSSNGTFVGEERITEVVLSLGEPIVVEFGSGGPRLRIYVGGDDTVPALPEPEEVMEETRRKLPIIIIAAGILITAMIAVIWWHFAG